MENVSPIKIGNQIVGTDHFQEYGIQIKEKDKDVINAYKPDPTSPKDIL